MTMRRGQTAAEYVLCLTALLVVIAVLGYVMTAALRSSDRATALVRADCP